MTRTILLSKEHPLLSPFIFKQTLKKIEVTVVAKGPGVVGRFSRHKTLGYGNLSHNAVCYGARSKFVPVLNQYSNWPTESVYF